MSNKWLIGLLVVSVAVNLALVGFLVGRMSSGFGPPIGMEMTIGIPRLLRELPDDRRQEILSASSFDRRQLRPALRAVRTAQQDIDKALVVEPFDPTDLEQALERFRETLDETQLQSHRSMIEVVSKLTAEERSLLAKSLRQRPRRSGPPGQRAAGRRPGTPDGPHTP